MKAMMSQKHLPHNLISILRKTMLRTSQQATIQWNIVIYYKIFSTYTHNVLYICIIFYVAMYIVHTHTHRHIDARSVRLKWVSISLRVSLFAAEWYLLLMLPLSFGFISTLLYQHWRWLLHNFATIKMFAYLIGERAGASARFKNMISTMPFVRAIFESSTSYTK